MPCNLVEYWHLAFAILTLGEILGANINRSPSAYLTNPAQERAQYLYDVDKNMTLLKFVDTEWGPVGAFSWFAVHGTSMNRTNELISGDNKGAAARFMEDWFRRVKDEAPSLKENDSIEYAHYTSITERSLRRRSSILSTNSYNLLWSFVRTISIGGKWTGFYIQRKLMGRMWNLI